MKFTKSGVGRLLSISTLIGAFAAPVMAEGEGVLTAPWKFHVNLYGWLPQAPATIDVGGEEFVDVPEDLDTILDSLEMAAMFELEAHKGPLVLFANTVYYKGDYDKNFTGVVSGLRRKFDLEEEVWAIKYGAGYEFGPWDLSEGPNPESLTLIPWAGGFYFHDDWEVKISEAESFDGVDKDGTLEFNTPMLGLGARVYFSENWYMNLSYGYGGWDVDDVDEVYDVLGNLIYRFEMWGTPSKVFAGYRYLHIDYEDKPVEVDVDVKGPFFGIGWEF